MLHFLCMSMAHWSKINSIAGTDAKEKTIQSLQIETEK